MQIDQKGDTGWIYRLTLESLSPADAPAMGDHLKRLCEFDRYSRFFSAMSDYGIDRYIAGFDWTRMVASGLYRDDRLIGVAELGWASTTDGANDASPYAAEMAVTVDADYRHRGIAGWLVKAVAMQGQRVGIRRMDASWVGGNDSIAKIMRQYDARIWLNAAHWHGTASLV